MICTSKKEYIETPPHVDLCNFKIKSKTQSFSLFLTFMINWLPNLKQWDVPDYFVYNNHSTLHFPLPIFGLGITISQAVSICGLNLDNTALLYRVCVWQCKVGDYSSGTFEREMFIHLKKIFFQLIATLECHCVFYCFRF